MRERKPATPRNMRRGNQSRQSVFDDLNGCADRLIAGARLSHSALVARRGRYTAIGEWR